MNVVGAPRGPVNNNSANDASSSASFQWYTDIPQAELSLEDFEDYALCRLKVLKTIEDLKSRNAPAEKYQENIKQVLKESTLATDSERDKISHFILRAAYCHTEDLRRWFTNHEVLLMKHRLDSNNKDNLFSIIKKFSLNGNSALNDLKPISNAKKEKLIEFLSQVPGSSTTKVMNDPFYEVPFEQALDLVSSRSCYLHHGMAYVPHSKVITILLARYRAHLSHSLTLASAAFGPMMEEQGRIAPLLKSMHHVSTVATGNPQQHSLDAAGTLTASSIDSALVPHMPLCMQQIHKGMQRDGKIRHWARLQYGLFLKGAGLSMEESLRFFQAKFHSLTSPDQFNKEYAYNIRHMYGKEGKRASYTSYSCTKIIVGNPPPVSREDHHGCPFRHCDEANLSRMLMDHLKLHNSTTAAVAAKDASTTSATSQVDASNRVAIQEILQLKRDNHYQLACLKHFELSHPPRGSKNATSMAEVGNHPNAWLSASVAYSSSSSLALSDTKLGASAVKHEENGTPLDSQTQDVIMEDSTTMEME